MSLFIKQRWRDDSQDMKSTLRLENVHVEYGSQHNYHVLMQQLSLEWKSTNYDTYMLTTTIMFIGIWDSEVFFISIFVFPYDHLILNPFKY